MLTYTRRLVIAIIAFPIAMASATPATVSLPTSDTDVSALFMHALKNPEMMLSPHGALVINRSPAARSTTNSQPVQPQSLTQLQQLQVKQQQLQQALATVDKEDHALREQLNALNQQIAQLSQTSQSPKPASIPQSAVSAAPAVTNPTTATSPSPETVTVTWSSPKASPTPTTTEALPTNTHPTNTPSAITSATHPVNTSFTPTKAILNSLTAGITALRPHPITSPPHVASHAVVPTILKPGMHTISPVERLTRWATDPTLMLRIGSALIALAMLLIVVLFWPKLQATAARRRLPVQPLDTARFEAMKQKNAERIDPILSEPPLTQEAETQDEPEQELSTEYDFLTSDSAIAIRLDLARAYMEMGNYQEARDAIEPIFEKGNDAQHEEAKELLRQIALAQTKIPVS